MLESARKLITRYIDLVNYILSSTIHVIEHAKNDHIEEMESSIQNRERLINQLAEVREKIDYLVNEFTSAKIHGPESALIKSWIKDSFALSSIVQDTNQYLIDYLMYKKSKMSKEIASIFEFQSKFKGYNLNNVRK